MQTYNVKQISKMFYVDDETVRRWIRNGTMKAHRHSKKEGFIINEIDLLDFVIRKPKYRRMLDTEALSGDRLSLNGLIIQQINELIRQRDELNEHIFKLQFLLEES